MKRLFACLLALALVFSLTAAQAVAYPERRGAVNDDAAVLSDAAVKDVETLNARGAGKYTVVTRHFLGGADAQEYCDGLFSAWNLGADDVLLLLVIGEERYAVTMGADAKQAISAEQLNSLLSSRLRQPFLQDRDYDGAVGAFLLAAAGQIARFKGVSLNTAGLFGTAAQSSASGAQNGGFNFNAWSGSNWWSGFFSDEDESVTGSDGAQVSFDTESGSGISMGKVILIGVIVLFFLRRRLGRGASGPAARTAAHGSSAGRTPPPPNR